jgi:hypothetical protein
MIFVYFLKMLFVTSANSFSFETVNDTAFTDIGISHKSDTNILLLSMEVIELP